MLNCEITEQDEKRRTTHCCTTIQPFRSYCQNGYLPSSLSYSFFFSVWQVETMPIIDNHEIESGHFKKHPKKWSSLFLFHSRDNRKKNSLLNVPEKSGKNRDINKAGHLESCR